MIISLVNSKGGVGKSTLAGNLAGWLARHGRSVILADCDTQQSSSEWITEALPELPVVRLADADAVLDELPSLAQEYKASREANPNSSGVAQSFECVTVAQIANSLLVAIRSDRATRRM